MALRSLFQQNTTYAASDLRALIDALGPQVIDDNGCVPKGLTVTYGSSKLTVAAGVGFATANASTTGHNFAVINTAPVDATNYAGGGTTWSPNGTGTTRIDIVYLRVDDVATDGAGADASTAYFRLNSTTLPDATCILLAQVESANGALTVIRDMRRTPFPANVITGRFPMVVTSRSTDFEVDTDFVALTFEDADVIDYPTFAVNVSDNWTMHRVSNSPITVPYAGWYEIGYRVSWGTSQANDVHAVGISVNDGTTKILTQGDMDGAANGHVQSGTYPVHLDVGDNVKIMVRSTDTTNVISEAEFWAKMISHD